MANTLTNEDKKRIVNERQSAVRNAWKTEKALVMDGRGTRNWSPDQQKQLIERGSVQGYEGHHMKSVSLYPEHAGNPQNIQFLSESEHLEGAHQGSYHNRTNGYFDPETNQMIEFEGDKLETVPVIELSESYSESQTESHSEGTDTSIDRARAEYAAENPVSQSTVDSESQTESHSEGTDTSIDRARAEYAAENPVSQSTVNSNSMNEARSAYENSLSDSGKSESASVSQSNSQSNGEGQGMSR